ncbi:uncharacterized protein LOC118197165 isoform X2 [Stegodyphus dumicola]|uniref:uncharacterized protein LOC118197165 isoform X2 n=1 Tax=Stegodyphus dumicola TaxID=202533 RepID=UPI0015AC1657|nr:uncharacterized protein LOC118197165 isoform X2 [Stegodyphus dumicola]
MRVLISDLILAFISNFVRPGQRRRIYLEMKFLAFAVLMFVSSVLSVCCEKARFREVYKGHKSKALKEYGEMKKSSVIQCATYCIQENKCYGFTMNASKTCRLLMQMPDANECPGDNCLEIEGFAVYIDTSS